MKYTKKHFEQHTSSTLWCLVSCSSKNQVPYFILNKVVTDSNLTHLLVRREKKMLLGQVFQFVTSFETQNFFSLSAKKKKKKIEKFLYTQCIYSALVLKYVIDVYFHSVPCSGMGRMQPFLSQLLYVFVGEAKQQMSSVSTGMDGSTHWQIIHLVWLARMDASSFFEPVIDTVLSPWNIKWVKYYQRFILIGYSNNRCWCTSWQLLYFCCGFVRKKFQVPSSAWRFWSPQIPWKTWGLENITRKYTAPNP